MPSPSPEVASAIADFAYELRRARRDAGELSLRDLARRMEHKGSPSTLQRAFKGAVLPSWRIVEALLSNGLDIPRDVIIRDWRPRWVAVKDLVAPLDQGK
ncbi:hypothetical protein GCM10022243_65270 [Saccharothrix violaceirubra]|uniref:Helix-turn-helix protein n=1 Tax=Saccharothrix violaceirubra TaxID=413306 RepID=A0A7W7WZ69_9PSEU|nr:helix-turn-helix domain-containing protein [Saccharothrix violaceirubra]MBB4968987.1 hypothetical protein [Saccharothrix violaceirubra]